MRSCKNFWSPKHCHFKHTRLIQDCEHEYSCKCSQTIKTGNGISYWELHNETRISIFPSADSLWPWRHWWLTDWLSDWLNDWLSDWLTEWLIDWLWLINRSIMTHLMPQLFNKANSEGARNVRRSARANNRKQYFKSAGMERFKIWSKWL